MKTMMQNMDKKLQDQSANLEKKLQDQVSKISKEVRGPGRKLEDNLLAVQKMSNMMVTLER